MSPDWPKWSTPSGISETGAALPSQDNVAGWLSQTVTSAAPGRRADNRRSARLGSPRAKAARHSACSRSGEVTARRPIPGASSSHVLQEARKLIDHAVSSIRTMSYLLHPPLLDEAG